MVHNPSKVVDTTGHSQKGQNKAHKFCNKNDASTDEVESVDKKKSRIIMTLKWYGGGRELAIIEGSWVGQVLYEPTAEATRSAVSRNEKLEGYQGS